MEKKSRFLSFCAPGNFYRGLQGCREQLEVLWEEGYRFIGTDGEGPPEAPSPAPFTQPYWYEKDGFPELLEIPITGWHCNMLFNTGHQNDNWLGRAGFPDGSILEKLPQTIEEGYSVRQKEFEFAVKNDLIYAPGMHPWSIYRFDPELVHLKKLIELAQKKNTLIMNCNQLYNFFRKEQVNYTHE